jgi:hypothetical protein
MHFTRSKLVTGIIFIFGSNHSAVQKHCFDKNYYYVAKVFTGKSRKGKLL